MGCGSSSQEVVVEQPPQEEIKIKMGNSLPEKDNRDMTFDNSSFESKPGEL